LSVMSMSKSSGNLPSALLELSQAPDYGDNSKRNAKQRDEGGATDGIWRTSKVLLLWIRGGCLIIHFSYPFRGWIWCVRDPETLPVVPVVRLYVLNGGCWGHGDGSQAIFERRSADQIHCGAMGFRFIPPPERVPFFILLQPTILNQRHGTMPGPLRWKVHRLTR
jgi:hypothetical protein